MTEGELAIYERQPDESAKAYTAFCLYRDLPSNIRSLIRAYRSQPGFDGANATPGRWILWSTSYGWSERVKAYDVIREKEARKIKEAAHDAALDEYRERTIQASRQQMETARAVLLKASARLDNLDINEIKPGQLAGLFRAAAHLADVSGKAEATALGLDELTALLEQDEQT